MTFFEVIPLNICMFNNLMHLEMNITAYLKFITSINNKWEEIKDSIYFHFIFNIY